MTKEEIFKVLRINNWELSKDKVGDSLANFNLDDRVICVIPNLKRLSSGHVLRMRESISTDKFSEIVSQIIGQKNSYYSLKTRFGPDFRSPNFSPKEILSILEEIKAWAETIKISAELELKRNLPTNSKGISPLHHLAALAMAKDLETLKHYKESFQKGDRLDFVPYIKEEHISRALKLGSRG